MSVQKWTGYRNSPKVVAVAMLYLIILTFILSSTASAFSGFGGYISDKLLGDGINEELYLGDGTSELIALGSSPIVSTLSATSSSAGNVVTMIISGSLQDLNGMPQARIWFQWGYNDSGIMTYSTTSTIITDTGEQTAIIYPDAGRTVYYRFLAIKERGYNGLWYPVIYTPHLVSILWVSV